MTPSSFAGLELLDTPVLIVRTDGSLDYVRDSLTGRTFVLRRGVDQRRQVAAELVAPR